MERKIKELIEDLKSIIRSSEDIIKHTSSNTTKSVEREQIKLAKGVIERLEEIINS